jgi:hypothetical protein
MDDKKTFFWLLEYSNKLKKDKKYLFQGNLEVFKLFSSFSLTITCNIHFLEKQEYIKLAEDFLTNKITPDDFSNTFQLIFQGVYEKFERMKKEESLELANFLAPNRLELGPLLADTHCSCLNLETEELKRCAKRLIRKLDQPWE